MKISIFLSVLIAIMVAIALRFLIEINIKTIPVKNENIQSNEQYITTESVLIYLKRTNQLNDSVVIDIYDLVQIEDSLRNIK
jgi:hypothetical protein